MRKRERFYALSNRCHKDDLVYVVGVLLGDGSVYRSHHKKLHWKTGRPTFTYTIELKAKDKEFVENFAQRLDRVLNRPAQRRHHIFPSGPYWRTVARRKSFGLWWEKLAKNDIEQLILRHPIDFLQGIYDSEGNLNNQTVRLFTTFVNIRDLICLAAHSIGLTTNYWIFREKGAEVSLPGDKKTTNTKTLWAVSISPRSKFLNLVQSSIPRKRA